MFLLANHEGEETSGKLQLHTCTFCKRELQLLGLAVCHVAGRLARAVGERVARGAGIQPRLERLRTSY